MTVSEALPWRIERLPLDPDRPYRVPFFVAWVNGKPDFRVADGAKMRACIKEKRCWVCGDVIGKFAAFTIGPMCAVNRVNSEPPSHRECAIYAARTCPFLIRPKQRRNPTDIPAESVEAAGCPIDRNPGVACVWITRNHSIFRANSGNAGVLFDIGDPVEVLWFKEARPATRAEVLESIDSGLPLLRQQCRDDFDNKALDLLIANVQKILPEETNVDRGQPGVG